MSDEHGVYRFVTLAPGRYQLRAHVPGGMAYRDEGREITVMENGSLGNLDFHLSPFKKGRWQHYSHADGLAENNVDCVFEAADGAMWFGTSDGVSRFDGCDFFTLTKESGLPGKSVRAIAGDTNGVMWFGTDAGLCRYDPRNLRQPFTTFSTNNGLPAASISALTLDKANRLWVGTRSGLSYYDGTNFVSFGNAVIRDSAPGGQVAHLRGNQTCACGASSRSAVSSRSHRSGHDGNQPGATARRQRQLSPTADQPGLGFGRVHFRGLGEVVTFQFVFALLELWFAYPGE
jgi:sugar lactone lactonase YvrE